MTRHDKLLENYEDALFALLMDQVAEEEGKQLLKENERLSENPDAAIPVEVDKRCRKAIQRAFAQDQRRSVAQISYRVLNKVALVALIAGLLFTTVYAAFPDVRIKTLNLLIEASDVATSLTLGSGGDSTTLAREFFGYDLSAIPEGFSVVHDGSDDRSAWIAYENGDGATIDISVILGSTQIHNVDTEDADNVEPIWINGYEGLLIEKGERVHIVWGDTDRECFVDVICTNLGKDTVISIAMNLLQ